MSTDHEDVKELIAPYVLGAVDPEEEALVRTHLRSCDECSREAEALGPVTASLASAVDDAPLPEGFAERTMDRVREEHGERDSARPARGRLAWVLSGAALVTATLIVALLALGGGGGIDSESVAELLERPGLALSGDGIEAKIVQTDEGTKFVARGLEPPPEGKVYVLWDMSSTCAPNTNGPCVTRPAGAFSEVQSGLVIAEFEGDLDDLQAAGMTIEEGPVEEPTTEPILTSF